jgi:hypothetical protein
VWVAVGVHDDRDVHACVAKSHEYLSRWFVGCDCDGGFQAGVGVRRIMVWVA